MNRTLAACVAVLVLVAAGCGRAPTSPYRTYPPPTFGPVDSSFTDDQVRAAVYSTYQWPPGFYHEDGYSARPYYLNTESIKPPCCRPLEWRDLATDDTLQARAWAESTIAYSNGGVPLAPDPALVTERFIEFRPDPAAGNRGIAMRAHRASYLEPLAFNAAFWSSDSLVGTFQHRPIELESARGLAEYLWFRWHPGGARVLSSYGFDEGDLVVHAIHEVEVVYGDYDMCDELRLGRLEFRIARETGEIVLRRRLERIVTGNCH